MYAQLNVLRIQIWIRTSEHVRLVHLNQNSNICPRASIKICIRTFDHVLASFPFKFVFEHALFFFFNLCGQP